MKKVMLGVCFWACTLGVLAQSITNDDLKDIRSSFKLEGETKALQNALSGNGNITAQALNRSALGKTDHYFKYRVNVKGITDQKKSGRCWMFTSMNAVRPSIMKQYNINSFDFSQNYLYFWDMFEKSNLFLENVMATSSRDMDDRAVVEYFKAPVADGGVWNLYFNLAEKYGVVPKEVMPETEHSENTRQLLTILKERLRAGGYNLRTMAEDGKSQAELKTEKVAVMKDVYRVLSLCLGEPPVQFTWRYKNTNGEVMQLKDYTPMQFYKETVPEKYSPDDFIMIMNDPTREYYKVYEIENYRNTIEGVNWVYLNLPNDVIKKSALTSIKNDEAMYISCDVGKFLNSKDGILDLNMYDYESLFGIDLKMDKKARILTRQSGSSHAMLLIGCDTDEAEKPLKWEVENSWGANAGHNGYLTLTNDWFDEYMFRFVINKKYLDSKSIKSLKNKPVVLPVWDYMF